MKGKLFVMSLAAVLLGCATAMAMPTSMISSSAAESNVEYSYWAGNKTTDPEATYNCGTVQTYTAAEAAAAGIPAGYEGNVISVQGGITRGIMVDFTAAKVPQGLISGLSVRYYCALGSGDAASASYPALRIPNPIDPSLWAYQVNKEDVSGEWATKEFGVSVTDKLCKDGYLGKFQLCLRTQDDGLPFYIDSITVLLKENDGVGPVIDYANGNSTVTVMEDAFFQETATAHDAQEKRDVPVTYAFGADTQFNADGSLKAGNWTVTLSAEDYYGNKTEKTVTLAVKSVDKTNPVISTNIQTMYAKVGTVPMLNITATDDSGEVKVEKTWSAGALDSNGGLTAGTHTYTITATDLFGNVTTHTITVIVSADGGLGDNFVDEQNKYDEWVAEQEMLPIRAAQAETIATLDGFLAMYSESDYSEANYALILAAYEHAKAGIYTETVKSEMEKWYIAFVVEAEGVKTLAQEGNKPSGSDSSVESSDSTSDSSNDSTSDTTDSSNDSASDSSSDSVSDSSDTPDTPNKPKEEKSGCGSTMAITTGIAVMALAAAVVCKKKEN